MSDQAHNLDFLADDDAAALVRILNRPIHWPPESPSGHLLLLGVQPRYSKHEQQLLRSKLAAAHHSLLRKLSGTLDRTCTGCIVPEYLPPVS